MVSSGEKRLIQYYKTMQPLISLRLNEFDYIWKNASEERLFSELCFCLCTPQSKAKLAHKAILGLIKNKNLFKGSQTKIRQGLSGVRFPNNKSKYIFEVRNIFFVTRKINVREYINKDDIISTREWLVSNVKGMGFKEASHFLRNIGLGKDIAILDKHILKNMLDFNVISEIPKTITKKNYLVLEKKLSNFSKHIRITLQELDLVFWSKQTGEVFK